MRRMILIILITLPGLAFAGWTEDMRITDRGYEIYPQIIARNDTLHVAWQQIAGDDLVSYMRSLDGGGAWDDIHNFIGSNHIGSWQDITLSSNRVMVSWWDIEIVYPFDQLNNLAYSISEGGETWPEPAFVYGTDFGGFYALATTLSGSSIYFAYQARERDSAGFYPILFLCSSDNGAHWTEERTVGYIYDNTNGMLIKKCGTSLIIVWAATPVPELVSYEVMCVISSDGGQTWSERLMLSEFGSPPAQLPCISCDRASNEIAVGWLDNGYPGDLFLRLSADGGYGWEPEIHVTDHHRISEPNIEFVGDTIWAVWDDRTISGNSELGFRKSIDRGESWSPIERLTNAEGQSHRAWLSYDNGKLHVVWDDDRPSHMGSDIYYKRWEPEVGITESNKPEKISLLSSYPNPFNSTTVISYANLKGGDIEIYDVAGRLVRKLIVGDSQEGPHGPGQQYQGKVAWDATAALRRKGLFRHLFRPGKDAPEFDIMQTNLFEVK